MTAASSSSPPLAPLSRETFVGPWAGLPVAWTEDDRFDEPAYRAAVAACCRAGVPGVYTAGTTGEFYAMELDEFQRVALATVEECRAAGVHSMIGVTSTYTLGAVRRAAYAARIGASAVQVALPFWMEVADDQIVPFFRQVAAAAEGLPISVYETTRAKKLLTLDDHRRIKQAVPQYLMVKANASTLGATEDGCRQLSELVNVFVGEHAWGRLGRAGAKGGCSSAVYWNPPLVLDLWQQVAGQQAAGGQAAGGQWQAVDAACARLAALFDFLGKEFGPCGFTDTAFDRLGAMAGGFVRPGLRSRAPYPCAQPDDVHRLRQWYREHWPEMLGAGWA